MSIETELFFPAIKLKVTSFVESLSRSFEFSF